MYIDNEILNISIAPVDINSKVLITGKKRNKERRNYIIGSTYDSWQQDVPSFDEIFYHDIYPGIDLKFYKKNHKLEYDIIINNYENIDNILFEVSGASNLEISRDGDLNIKNENTILMTHVKPEIFQLVNGKSKTIDGKFVIKNKKNENYAASIYGFEINQYDIEHPVIIDPTIEFSTIVGGEKYDFGRGVGIDPSGNIIVAGHTESLDFPNSSGIEILNQGGRYDCFITKLTPDGKNVIFSTYFGGSGDDQCKDLAVDKFGNIYLTGFTNSADFPTVNALFPKKNENYDAFIIKINPEGNAILFSSFLGGNEYDVGYGVAVDNNSNLYVTGTTYSNDFPTFNPLYPNIGAFCDVFICKIDVTQSTFVYSTYFPGRQIDKGYDVAADDDGHAYVTCTTNSPDFPTKNEKENYSGMAYDAFVCKINSSGSDLIYSTYIASFYDAHGKSIAIDSNDCAWVTGMTYSTTNMATDNALFKQNSGDYDAFITKMNPTGDKFLYSTYLGGSKYDAGHGIVVDQSDNVHVIGDTTSSDFPTANALYPIFSGDHDIFITSLDSTGTKLKYSTFLGGSSLDIPYGIVSDLAGCIVIGGYTKSLDFPTVNAYDNAFNGHSDVVIIKLDTLSD